MDTPDSLFVCAAVAAGLGVGAALDTFLFGGAAWLALCGALVAIGATWAWRL
jgi:hypothetical protein